MSEGYIKVFCFCSWHLHSFLFHLLSTGGGPPANIIFDEWEEKLCGLFVEDHFGNGVVESGLFGKFVVYTS